jgi:hypothetical protein
MHAVVQVNDASRATKHGCLHRLVPDGPLDGPFRQPIMPLRHQTRAAPVRAQLLTQLPH